MGPHLGSVFAIVFFDFGPPTRSRRCAPAADWATSLRSWCDGTMSTARLRRGVLRTPTARSLLSSHFICGSVPSLVRLADHLAHDGTIRGAD